MNKNHFFSLVKTLFFGLIFSFLPGLIFAQNAKIIVKVIDKQKDPVPFATVKISEEKDSILSFEQVTDSLGVARFQLLHQRKYTVSISAVNHSSLKQGIALMNSESVFTFILDNKTTTLDAVVIKSSKPLMRQEDDKTIVDPENLAASSSSGYEVLEKIPGIFMDQDGNIYLNSTTPAAVYINGREQKMSTADIASILKSLPPNSIASIEILRTPSAKYDASGSGGVVNVILRKGIKIGVNGSVNAGIQQGNFGTQFAGFNLNNSNGDLSTYLNVQATHKNTFDEIKTDRIFAPDSILSQNARTTYPGNNYYLGYGLNYQLNKKWTISYDGRVSLNNGHSISANTSLINQISSDKTLSSNTTNVDNNNNSFFLSQGVSGKYSIDSLGSEWTNDISFNFSPNKTIQNFSTDFTLPALAASLGEGNLKTDLRFFSVASNLLWKFPRKYTIETGIKSTITDFKNNTQYFQNQGSSKIVNTSRTSAFDYHEMINAGYLQASKTFSTFTIKAGTRVENTRMDGEQ
ncbi:MAG: outer membrane beta-barrel protein, partial [Ginsengibacter sp.]